MLAQDVVIANYFSTGAAADAYQLAVSFPLLAINVLAGGTLLAVLVPLLTRYKADEREAEAARLVKRARCMLGWVLFVVCGVWALAYPHVTMQFAAGFSVDTLALSSHLLWLAIPALYFAGLAGVDAAVLNSRRRFVFVSILPAFMPAGVILCVFLLGSHLGIYAAAIGLLCGSATQWMASRRLALPFQNHLDRLHLSATIFSHPARDYGMAAASAALLAGILLTDTFMASAQPAGGTAAYGYAVRPVILFLAFVTAVIGNVILPFFSHLVANQDWTALKRHTLFWFGLVALGSLPVVILWHAYALEIVALLYQRGAFVADDTARIASVQKIYLLQIPFFLVAVIGWRVMNSLNRHAILLAITAVCFIVNLAADMWMAPRYGLQGIAWGTNLAFALWAIFIACYLLRLHGGRTAIVVYGGEIPSPTRTL